MPNHVINVLKFAGSEADIQTLKQQIKGSDVPITFDKIIHMPESLNIGSGTSTYNAIRYFLAVCQRSDELTKAEKEAVEWFQKGGSWFKELEPMKAEERADFETRADLEQLAEAMEVGYTGIHNIIDHGALTWYEWRIEHWGTKWDAYDVRWVDEELVFSTAWSPAVPVIRTLSRMFPTVRIDWRWADEDMGHNLGHVVLEGGDLIGEKEDEDTMGADAAVDFANKLWGDYLS